MFKNARIKLTAWYLLIIMLISVSFSLVIYRDLSAEFDRFSRAQHFRIQFRTRENENNPSQINQRLSPPSPLETELVEETKRRLIIFLILINGGILIISGGVGYFLAGKTLAPIGQMLEEQNRFISDASHELRTPLTSLKTAMEVRLRDKNCTDTETNLLKDSLFDVNKLSYLSDQLLKLAQYKKPDEDLKFERVNLAAVIKQVVEKMKPLAENKKIALINKAKTGEIKGNKYSLEDLLMILLDNAVKYTPVNKRIVIASVKKNKSIYLSVKDEGIGIEAKDIPNIFNRFFRADSARSKTGVGGYGLGLSIAKRIVETNNGIIKVESKMGRGTTFTIIFPALS